MLILRAKIALNVELELYFYLNTVNLSDYSKKSISSFVFSVLCFKKLLFFTTRLY